ncbi:MAG: alkaline phosphatase family protein, partial [Muribaculaceae bacterium]|nr:alkaline phosphatase family protein [Muribaculaceae bacterium]
MKPTSRAPRLLLTFVASAMATLAVVAATPARPQLVVGIVVEGLEQDYVDLLRESFTSGGFNRLLSRGVVIPALDYGTPLDAQGATAILMSGATADISGIDGASRFDREALRTVPLLHDPAAMGSYTNETYSPAALAVSTIADEARIAGGGITAVYALAADPQQALLLGGHAANSALWINTDNGNWATSTFYKEPPVSLASRNRLRPLSVRLDTMSWTPLRPAEAYTHLPDHLTRYPFRYTFGRSKSERVAKFLSTPLLNSEITQLAAEIIATPDFGAHDGPDMINLAYTIRPFTDSKSADTRYELMDSYLRLDRDLEQLFAAVDKGPGMDRTLIYLAATPPGSRTRKDDDRWSVPFGEFSTRKAISLLNMYLIALHGNGDWVKGYHRNAFYLNEKLIKERNIDPALIRTESADFLERMSGVRRAFTIDDIINERAGEGSQAIRRNTSIAHSGDVYIAPAAGWEVVDDWQTPAPATRTPMVHREVAPTGLAIIMAPGVDPRTIDTPVDARVIAPTVARILRIRSPNGA